MRSLKLDPFVRTALIPTAVNRYLYVNNDPINLLDPNGTVLNSATYIGGARMGMAAAAVAVLLIGTQVMARRIVETIGFPEQPFPDVRPPSGCDGFYTVMIGACIATWPNEPIKLSWCAIKATAVYIFCKIGAGASKHGGDFGG